MDVRFLTRRDVLKQLGFLGGSSLVMGAMGTWDLMGQSTGSRPIWTGSRPDTRVIILGGGLSGLTVGYELGKLDYDYHILEARDEVGGLMWTVRRGATHTEIGGETQTCDFDEGQYLNAGAWRIPNADKGILGYCKELRVPLELFVNLTWENYHYDEDPQRGPLAGRRVKLKEAKADLWGSVSELLAKAMDQGDIDAGLTSEDQDRLVEWMVRAGYLDSEDFTYRPPRSRGSQDRHDLSALLRSGFGTQAATLYAGTGGADPVFQPVGGMQEIPFAFQRAIGDRLSLGSEVRSIRQTEDEVRVVYRDTRTGAEQELVGDYCICCLPMNVLKTIDVELSSDMALAVSQTRHSGSAKMGLQMKRRFWEEDDGIYGGHIFGRGLGLGEFSYPSNDYFGDKGVLLGFYGGGGTGGLDEMSVQDRVEYVLTQASKVHPQMRSEFDSAYAVWWNKVPYSLGAYGSTPNQELRDQFSKPDGRLYFGSAGTSGRPAWLEGAIQSAWRTTEALHQRAMQD